MAWVGLLVSDRDIQNEIDIDADKLWDLMLVDLKQNLSTAAFSMVVSKTLAMLYNEKKNVDKVFLALASQWAENTYFGKKSGLQDQLGSCSDGMEILDFENLLKPNCFILFTYCLLIHKFSL